MRLGFWKILMDTTKSKLEQNQFTAKQVSFEKPNLSKKCALLA